MAVPWLLIAVVGLAATEVSCQDIVANPPPLPTAGMLLVVFTPRVEVNFGINTMSYSV